MTVEQLPPLIPLARAAQYLDQTTHSVRNAVNRGELPAKRWGRRILISRDELIAYLGGGAKPA